MVGSGIRFNDFVFSEPVLLNGCTLPKFAGLFVVLASDANWAPRPFQPLWFGEFGNNAPGPVAVDSARMPANAGPLFIAVLAMPFSTSAQRSDARDQLVWAYNPFCQGNARPQTNEMARKLDQLETQFQILITSINRLFEPVPVPPRRPIGFLPQSGEPAPCAGGSN